MQYSRENPFLSTLIERRKLSQTKDTEHLVLSLKGSGITYEVGDCIGVYPLNPPELIEKTLNVLKVSGSEEVVDKRSGKTLPFKEFITSKGSITGFSRKFLTEVAGEIEDPKRMQEEFEVWDLIKKYGNPYDLQTFADRLMPLLPRLYSIASSSKLYPDEVHLTVSHLLYQTHGEERVGVCTHYLCRLAPLNTPAVPIYLHPHKGFTLPKDPNIPIIMIGPGTGVAPFVGFIQERALHPGSKNWLFFGEWTKANEFFYQNEFEKFVAQGALTLDTAFSRDQAEKIYVQHRLLEKGPEVMRWLEEGAILYVCGDARRMARDVDAAIHTLVSKESHHDPVEYVKALKKEGRYLRDVY